MPVQRKRPYKKFGLVFNKEVENQLNNKKISVQKNLTLSNRKKNVKLKKGKCINDFFEDESIHSLKYSRNNDDSAINYECELDLCKDIVFKNSCENYEGFSNNCRERKNKISDGLRMYYNSSWEALKEITHVDMKNFKKENCTDKNIVIASYDKNEFYDENLQDGNCDCSIDDEFSSETIFTKSSSEEDEVQNRVSYAQNKAFQKLNQNNSDQFAINDSNSSKILEIDRNDPELRIFAAEIGIDIDDDKKPNKIFRLDHLTPSYIDDPPIPNGNILGGHYGFASEFQLKEKYSTETFDFLLNVVKDYALFLKEHPGSPDYPSVSELMVHSDQKLSDEDSEKARYYDNKYLRTHQLAARVGPCLPCNNFEKKIQDNPKLVEALKYNKCIKMKQKEEVSFGYYASFDEIAQTGVGYKKYAFPKKREIFRHGPLSQDEVNEARKTGILNLSHRSLLEVPERIWSIDVITKEDRKSYEKNFEIPLHSSLWWTFKSLVSLNLSYNSLTTFCPQGSALISLRELRVTNNLLEKLPDEIGSLQNLTFLDLDTNSLKILPDTLCNLKMLEELKLKRNFIEELPINIGNLISLQKLDLSFNKIVKLPDSISDLIQLESINISFNKLSALPQNFNHLSCLEVLDVSYNKLINFPSMENFPNLIVVNATCNAIHLFPDFSGCQMLTELRLDGNNIKNVVAENLKQCPLIQLTMSNNKVEAIPDDIYHLSTLVLIDFSNNHLMWLPWSLARLKYLTVLNVDSNNISNVDRATLEAGSNKIIEALREKLIRYEGDDVLNNSEREKNASNFIEVLYKKFSVNAVGELHPKDKAEIKKTRHLDCSNMELLDIPSVLLQEAKASRILKVDLTKNLLNFVPVGLKTLMPHLTQLILKDNYLKTIPDFIGRMKLVLLDVSFNYLETFPLSMGTSRIQKLFANNNCFSAVPKVIYSIQSLEHVDFSGNKITEIDADRLKNLINLSYLNFKDNSIERLPRNLNFLPNLSKLKV